MIFLEQTLAILWKDIRCELRSKQTWMGMGMFALLVLVIFNFAFDLRVDNKAAIAPGALWVAFVFASLLGLGRTITAEREKGLMDRLLLCPVNLKAIYLAKLLGNLLFIGVVEVVALPVFAALFNVPLFGALLPIVLLGTLGVAAIGTLLLVFAGARAVSLALMCGDRLTAIGIAYASRSRVSPTYVGLCYNQTDPLSNQGLNRQDSEPTIPANSRHR